MKIDRQTLLRALEIVKPGIASREIFDQSNSFVFMGNHIVSFNNEVSISQHVDGLDLQGAVKAEEFYKIIAKIKKEELVFTVVKNELIIEAGRSKAGISFQEDVKLPVSDIGDVGRFVKLPDEFISALELALPSASTNMGEVLNSVHINKKGTIEATNGKKLMWVDVGVEFTFDTIFLPVKSAQIICKMQPTHISKQKGWVHFQKEGGLTISCRTMDSDAFPDTSVILKSEGRRLQFPKAFKEALDLVFVFKEINVVEILLADNKMRVKSQNITGWIEETINVKYDDVPVCFFADIDSLKRISEQECVCFINDKLLIFQGENWKYFLVITIQK